MRTLRLLPALLLALGACKPELGEPESLVSRPKLLAVRGEPPEAAPGEMVRYDLLLATPDGTDTSTGAQWSICRTPKPPAEGNSVSATCVQAPPEGEASVRFEEKIPTAACTLFGPITPPAKPGEPPLRPRDPDATGGYYLPVRALVPSVLEPLTAFALERTSCNLAGASVDVVQEYNKRYKRNVNPKLGTFELPPSVSSAETVTLRAGFAPDAAETFPVLDLETRTLVDRRESLRLSWFATAGKFEHDRTGRAEDEEPTPSENQWTAPAVTAPTTVHLWLVLRDSRGGIDFAGYELSVAP